MDTVLKKASSWEINNFSERNNVKKAISWEINNFSERNNVIKSDPFSNGGCEWCICVYPKGNIVDDHLSVFLFAMNPESLLCGWRRRATYRFVLLNHSGKELRKTTEERVMFCAEAPGWGYHRMLPLKELFQLLEKNKLTIEVYIKEVESVHRGTSTENEIVPVNGFHVLNTQVISVSKIFAEYPDVALDVKSNIREVKTAYMKLLLGNIETLSKSPQSLSETDLMNVGIELNELIEAGFKLDWLKSKLEKVYLDKKKEVTVQKLEERIKNVDLITSSDLKVDLVDKEEIKSATAAKVSSLEFMDVFLNRFFLSCFSISKT